MAGRLAAATTPTLERQQIAASCSMPETEAGSLMRSSPGVPRKRCEQCSRVARPARVGGVALCVSRRRTIADAILAEDSQASRRARFAASLSVHASTRTTGAWVASTDLLPARGAAEIGDGSVSSRSNAKSSCCRSSAPRWPYSRGRHRGAPSTFSYVICRCGSSKVLRELSSCCV
jgi:hypothetical protein